MEKLSEIPVAKVVNLRGVQMGQLEQDQAWEEVFHGVKLQSTRLGITAFEEKILLVHRWIYPSIFNVLEIYELTQNVLGHTIRTRYMTCYYL